MLHLEGTTEWHTHEISGARFEVAAMPADRYFQLLQAHRLQNGEPDVIGRNVAVCQEVIKNWDGVGSKRGGGPVECTPENVEKFARAHTFGVANWVIDVARALDRFLEEKTADAKKD